MYINIIVGVVWCLCVGYSSHTSAAVEAGITGQDSEHQPVTTDDDGRMVAKNSAHIGLGHFTFVKVLGKGSFGKV